MKVYLLHLVNVFLVREQIYDEKKKSCLLNAMLYFKILFSICKRKLLQVSKTITQFLF